MSLLSATSLGATIFDPAADFSSASNPAGVWSYGETNQLGSAFRLFAELRSPHWGNLPASVWLNNDQPVLPGHPFIAHNDSDSELVIDNLAIPPRGLSFHPGPRGEYAVLRWTAPSSGVLELGGKFTSTERLNWPPTSSDVHVLHTGSSLFDGEIRGHVGVSAPFAAAFEVLAAGTVDFVVGWGFNRDFQYDNTGLAATISFDAFGDTNDDGLVNIDDLNEVRNFFGTAGPADGSLDGDAYPFDGNVDVDDLNLVRNNCCQLNGPVVSIPEPSTVLLLVAGGIMIVHRHRTSHFV